MESTIGSGGDDLRPALSAFTSIGSCFLLASFFVGSLYVWKPYPPHERDVPANVKRRFISVTVAMAISPLLVYALLHNHTAQQPNASVAALMGLRTDGLCAAIVLPLVLTAMLFAGPLYVQYLNGELAAKACWSYWRHSFSDILWIRNHVMAPISEEFTFRACMMPLLLHAFRPPAALLLTPLFFGLAHVHHAVERWRAGLPLGTIVLHSFVQFAYTSVFGIYSAYLFARTGHYVAPVVAHAFCNHMGVPNVGEVVHEPDGPKRRRMAGAYVAGLVGWSVMLAVLTRPSLFANTMYWK